ncbi:conserved hypothetical protein [Streptomyces sp. e14]|nr:conserved hypothetical protein [Streptomyces sp. e14]
MRRATTALLTAGALAGTALLSGCGGSASASGDGSGAKPDLSVGSAYMPQPVSDSMAAGFLTICQQGRRRRRTHLGHQRRGRLRHRARDRRRDDAGGRPAHRARARPTGVQERRRPPDVRRPQAQARAGPDGLRRPALRQVRRAEGRDAGQAGHVQPVDRTLREGPP